MTNDLDSLARMVRKKRNSLPKKVSKATQKVATEMLSHLANNTPVDTSQAISNWQVNIGSPIGTTRGPLVPGIAGSTKAASVAAVLVEGAKGIKHHEAGKAIHISNNLHYIRGLNDGSISLQASGFVQGSMVKGRAELKKIKLDW